MLYFFSNELLFIPLNLMSWHNYRKVWFVSFSLSFGKFRIILSFLYKQLLVYLLASLFLQMFVKHYNNLSSALMSFPRIVKYNADNNLIYYALQLYFLSVKLTCFFFHYKIQWTDYDLNMNKPIKLSPIQLLIKLIAAQRQVFQQACMLYHIYRNYIVQYSTGVNLPLASNESVMQNTCKNFLLFCI